MTNISLESLSMDILRVARAYRLGSVSTGKRFTTEAVKRISQIDDRGLQPYMKKVVTMISSTLQLSDIQVKAERLLMYSTLIQNYLHYGKEKRKNHLKN